MRIEYHPALESELVEVRDYYNDRLPGLGDDFVDEFERLVLRQAPPTAQCQRRHSTVRRSREERTPGLSIHDRHSVTAVEIDEVVAPDSDARRGSRAVGIARLGVCHSARLGPALHGSDLVRREDWALATSALERSERPVGPVSLQVGVAVGRSGYDPSGLRGYRRRQRERGDANPKQPCRPTDRS